MYDLLKNLSQNSAFYTFANSIEAFSPFLLAIILTRQLTPEEYGVWVLFIALVTFLRPLVSLTIQDALRMHFFEMGDAERARFAWSSLCLTTACTATFIAVTLVLAKPLSLALSLPAEWLVTIPVAAYLYAMFYFLLAFNQFAPQARELPGPARDTDGGQPGIYRLFGFQRLGLARGCNWKDWRPCIGMRRRRGLAGQWIAVWQNS